VTTGRPEVHNPAAILAAVAAGVLHALAFEPVSLAGAAYLSPACILLAALLRPSNAFRQGWIAAATSHLLQLHWLLNIPVAFAPVLGWAALSAFLALFTGAWTWLGVMLWRREADSAGAPSALKFLALPLAGAVLWVAAESMLARLWGGFPWNQLAVSQHQQVPLLQLASVTGPAGLSLLVCWISLALMQLALLWRRGEKLPASARVAVFLPLLCWAVAVAWGFSVISKSPPPARTLRLALVQPSVPQTLVWSGDDATNRLERLLELSATTLTNDPVILVWPEAGLPGFLNHDEWLYRRVAEFARAHRVWIVCGSDDAAPREDDAGAVNYFNSAFLMNPDGRLVAKYDKRRLVMFGEFVPFARWLPFLKWFTPISGGFTPGSAPARLDFDGPGASAGMLICFEDIFPVLARDAAGTGADFLLNLTNDGWFGNGSQQWSHAANSVLRAVETGRPLVRCTNNGLTCWVDRHGRIRDWLRHADGGIHAAGTLTVAVELHGGPEPRTFFQRRGDWVGWGCVLAGAALALRLLARGLPRRPSPTLAP
jgi:apolipoprotein N-acyltransferase